MPNSSLCIGIIFITIISSEPNEEDKDRISSTSAPLLTFESILVVSAFGVVFGQRRAVDRPRGDGHGFSDCSSYPRERSKSPNQNKVWVKSRMVATKSLWYHMKPHRRLCRLCRRCCHAREAIPMLLDRPRSCWKPQELQQQNSLMSFVLSFWISWPFAFPFDCLLCSCRGKNAKTVGFLCCVWKMTMMKMMMLCAVSFNACPSFQPIVNNGSRVSQSLSFYCNRSLSFQPSQSSSKQANLRSMMRCEGRHTTPFTFLDRSIQGIPHCSCGPRTLTLRGSSHVCVVGNPMRAWT